MKNRTYGFLSIVALLTVTMMLAGCAGKKKEAVTDPVGSSAASETVEDSEDIANITSEDVDMDYILDRLQAYAGEIGSITLDQQITVPLSIPAGDDADISVYRFIPDTSGIYNLEVSIPEDYSENTYISIIDQNANTLNEYPDTTAGMIMGQQYFLVFYTETENSDKEVSFEITGTLKLVTDEFEFDELQEGENEFTIEAESEKAAVFIPAESSYYSFDAHCLDSEHGTAVIDTVLREGETDVSGTQGLYYMEEGYPYLIIYGAYETGTKEADVCIDIEAFDVVELKDQDMITTKKNVILKYTAKSNEAVLVYSVSDSDPRAVVYNQDYDVVAQNSDADGELSDNEHDFALLVYAEENKDYYIVVDHVEDNPCEIHVEMAKM